MELMTVESSFMTQSKRKAERERRGHRKLRSLFGFQARLGPILQNIFRVVIYVF
jgi:hypothetical protein